MNNIQLKETYQFEKLRKHINYICRNDWNGRISFVDTCVSLVKFLIEGGFSFEEINKQFTKSKSENVRYHWSRIAKEFE